MNRIILRALVVLILVPLLGLTMLSIPSPVAAAAVLAIAPDDPDIMASIDVQTNIVSITSNGGATWHSLGVPQDFEGEAAIALYDIAISPESVGIHYIAVAGQEPGPKANIWYWKYGSFVPAWYDTSDYDGFAATSGDFSVASAVAFSPAFPFDQVMVAVTANWDGGSGNDLIYFEIFSFNQKYWNQEASFDNYPVLIAGDDGITGLDSASIDLDDGYLGWDEETRIATVDLIVLGDADAQALSGCYQLYDNVVQICSEEPLPDGEIEVGGDAYPVNKAAILAPWITLAVIIITGVIILAKRGQTQS